MQTLNDSRDFQWAMEDLRKKRRKGKLVNNWERARELGIIKSKPAPYFEDCKKFPQDDPLYHSRRLYRLKHMPVREWEIFDGVSTKKRFSIKRENELINDVMYLILSERQTKGLLGRIYKKYKLDKDDLLKIKAMVQKEFCYPELLQYKDTAKEFFRPSWLDLGRAKRTEKKIRSKNVCPSIV